MDYISRALRVFEFEYVGDIVAQQRARSAVKGNRVINYDPKKSRDFKEQIRLTALATFGSLGEDSIITKPVCLEVFIYRDIPSSFSKTNRNKALSGELLPTTKPDLKNYIVGIEDALEGLLYYNDSQIVSYGRSVKLYGEESKLECRVIELDIEGSKSFR